ncbi:hypothetical protein THASP1DRAFT_24365 [Thamnocephalis sphaerospora]|uniref:Uncharacterized protein n=1 Tax=Thamnocephalis sphaerospora TaxID=78915 RepID=A0A4P9XNF6_9FUNG|nr:hypothetical protein THASP1DRAFT_24365 [Thamnocephalis sphaerospora]|eukprot:RKP07493.1 hypothetical protein THASP1DRAFT_24365 [Thamnocephalis sphaerospora]
MDALVITSIAGRVVTLTAAGHVHLHVRMLLDVEVRRNVQVQRARARAKGSTEDVFTAPLLPRAPAGTSGWGACPTSCPYARPAWRRKRLGAKRSCFAAEEEEVLKAHVCPPPDRHAASRSSHLPIVHRLKTDGDSAALIAPWKVRSRWAG